MEFYRLIGNLSYTLPLSRWFCTQPFHYAKRLLC